MTIDTTTKMTIARTQLLLDYPFFGSLALRLRMEPDSSPLNPTMSVDGKTIRYNPEWVDSISTGLTRAVVAHEVMHCVFEHTTRRDGRDPKKWNVAGDHVINLMLTESGLDFEGTGLMDPAFKGMTTDQVYALLPDGEAPDVGEPGGPLDRCLDGDSETKDIDSTEWKIATIQAANAAKAMGKLPAHLERFVDQLVVPKVDWRERLRRFVTEVSRDDYTWARPNRRYLAHNMYLPSLHSESMGEIVVAIDTSGSIDQVTLNAFGSEIKAIVQSVRPAKTTVIYCDAAVNHVDEFLPNDELKFKLHGGGGTDFRPPFALLEKENKRPVCFVYLTDMYGTFPKDPGYPVMWCATTNIVGPFGETVPIEV